MARKPVQVGIVGGGLSGLAAAVHLAATCPAASVRVFEKSARGTGRVQSRRLAPGFLFDMGAQYFTVRDPRFASKTEALIAAGRVAEWNARVVSVPPEPERPIRRLVGVPSMSALTGALAEEAAALSVAVGFEQTVSALDFDAESNRWQLVLSTGERSVPLDYLVLTCPAEQAAALLETSAAVSDSTKSLARSVEMEPCWAVGVALSEADSVAVEADGVFFKESAVLSWAARDGSKPGRQEKDCWTLHARSEWTKEHWEDAKDDVVQALVMEFASLVGIPEGERVLRDARAVTAFRWKFAKAKNPLSMQDGHIRDGSLFVVGDWVNRSRVEGAFVSGWTAADAIAKEIKYKNAPKM